MTDVVYKNEKTLKQDWVVNIEDKPQYVSSLLDLQQKTHKIKYEVGDDCVFEITKGDKKWTISLDDFFDKVIQICGEQKDD